MARPSVNEDAKMFVKELRKLKATVGNGRLCTLLGW